MSLDKLSPNRVDGFIFVICRPQIDLKSAIRMRKAKKIKDVNEILPTFFCCHQNFKSIKRKEILHSQKHSPHCIRLWKWAVFFFFLCFIFYFLCKLRF